MNTSFALAAIAILIGTAGCGSSDTTTSTPTTPTVTRTTDTFSGTVAVGGHDFHTFVVGAAGPIDVTLTVANPSVVMGLAIGTPGATCPPLAGATVNAAPGATAQLGGLASAGTLCVDVRDVGSQSAPVTYTVTVLHP